MSCKYQETIDILTSQGKFYINLGLERVQRVLNLIGNPQNKLHYIHVAGTNGKGSVCAMLSSILAKCKMQNAKCMLKIGLFTSPHVFEYTERIKINDIEISQEEFTQKIIEITKLADKNQIHLTEFEILTVVAFQYFEQNNVDIVILETGLGGRLDATNVIKENICSIITNIDFDHTERLGDTIEKIAAEKAGIIKQNCLVVISKNNLGYETVKRIAENLKSQIFEVSKEQNLPKIDFALKGIYQKENLALVLAAIEILNKNGFNITQENIEHGLKNVHHSCRFEYIKEHNLIIDGAHNPNGTKALRESLDYYFPNQKFKFIFGCLKNKDYVKMMDNLFAPTTKAAGKKSSIEAFTPDIYFYQFDNANSCSYKELAKVCKFDSKPFSEFKKDSDTLTVICGSFYMIKELLTKMALK